MYLDGCTIGDWFVLYQMSKNLNRRFFYDFLLTLAHVDEAEDVKVLIDKDPESGDDEIKKKFLEEQGCEDGGPPPLMQGSPRSMKRILTV
jgi:hypothetical protein